MHASRALAYLPGTALLIDEALVTVCAAAAALGRERLDLFDVPAGVASTLGPAVPLVVVIWLACIALLGGYSSSVFDVGTDEYGRVARAGLLTAGVVGVGCYLLKFQLSRGFFSLLFLLGVPALLLGRAVLRASVVRARRRGALLHSVLLVGSPHSIDDLAQVLRRERRLGYSITGALTPTDEGDETPMGIPVIGRSTDVTDLARTSGADIVFFVDGGVSSSADMRRIAWDFEGRDVQVVVAPSVSDVSGDRVTMRPVGGLPLIHIDPPRSTDAARWGKRVFDVVGALGLLLVASPLMLVAALRVATDKGPVLFRQTRVGRNGELFSCLKFRTMVVDAEARLAELHAAVGHEGGLFKMKDDPRITKPGRWLRRFSIDEMPQLWNVVRGDMSLVGPRPPLPSEVAAYDDATARRLHVRPGLTGLWQVSGRSELSFEEAIRLDLYYVDNWSMFADLAILIRTLGAVVGSRGAY